MGIFPTDDAAASCMKLLIMKMPLKTKLPMLSGSSSSNKMHKHGEDAVLIGQFVGVLDSASDTLISHNNPMFSSGC